MRRAQMLMLTVWKGRSRENLNITKSFGERSLLIRRPSKRARRPLIRHALDSVAMPSNRSVGGAFWLDALNEQSHELHRASQCYRLTSLLRRTNAAIG